MLASWIPVFFAFLEDGPLQPKGPGDWSAKNWIGFVLYIAVFLAVVAFIFYIGRDEEDEAPEEPTTDA